MNSEGRLPSGFTLIELLVVIAIIAVLMGVIMPALHRAREMGKRAVCLNNTKSLATAWTLYCSDHDGMMPPPMGLTSSGWVWGLQGTYATRPTEAPREDQIAAIRAGALYRYVNTENVYRCPVAGKREMRTYSAAPSMNADERLLPEEAPVEKNLNRMRQLSTRLVYIDDFGENWDAMWYIWYAQARWWNPVPMRHGAGTVASFADVHAEFHAWKDARTIEYAKMTWQEAEARRGSAPVQSDNEDLRWAQTAVWGKLGYEFQP